MTASATYIKSITASSPASYLIEKMDGETFPLDYEEAHPHSSDNTTYRMFWFINNQRKVFRFTRSSLTKGLKISQNLLDGAIARTKDLDVLVGILKHVEKVAGALFKSKDPIPVDAWHIAAEIETRRREIYSTLSTHPYLIILVANRTLIARKNPVSHYTEFYLVLDDPLGKGAFRTVYPLYDYQRGKTDLAISFETTREELHQKQLREGESLTKLTGIANIISTKFYAIYDSQFFVVTERCLGPCMRLLENSSVALPLKLELFKQILEGVVALHASGIAHRDLKPPNILVLIKDNRIHIKIIDFNIACSFSDEVQLKRLVGTMPYQAPESFSCNSKKYPDRLDCWSLGIILYQILEHQRPPFTLDLPKNRTLYGPSFVFSKVVKGVKNLVFKQCAVNDPLPTLIKNLLQPAPKRRLTSREALKHIVNIQSTLPLPMGLGELADILSSLTPKIKSLSQDQMSDKVKMLTRAFQKENQTQSIDLLKKLAYSIELLRLKLSRQRATHTKDMVIEILRGYRVIARKKPRSGDQELFLALAQLSSGAFRSTYALLNYQTGHADFTLTFESLSQLKRAAHCLEESRFFKELAGVEQVMQPEFTLLDGVHLTAEGKPVYVDSTAKYVLVMKREVENLGNTRLSKPILLKLFGQLLKGCAALHEKKIVHRNLKPQTLLIQRQGNQCLIKITGFQVACRFSDKTRLACRAGTIDYLPPEVLTLPALPSHAEILHPDKIDCWSLGVILYKLYENSLPFSYPPPPYGQAWDKQAERSAKIAASTAQNLPFTQLSPESPMACLIKGLLDPNPVTRLSAAMAHQKIQAIL